MGFMDTMTAYGGGGILSENARDKAGDWLWGTPGQFKKVSNLNKGQQGLHQQLINALTGQGGGGAFGNLMDYYNDLFNPNGQNYQAMAAPEMRQFNEQIIPGLSEQFAGMGSGALSSSGFRNAAVNAGTDLSERLAAIRANLRQQGSMGLMNMGQMGFNPVFQNAYMAGQPGMMQPLMQGVGQGIGQLPMMYAGMPPVPKPQTPVGG